MCTLHWSLRAVLTLVVVLGAAACSSSNGLNSGPPVGVAGSGTGGATSSSNAGTGSGFHVNTTGGSGGTGNTTQSSGTVAPPACGDGLINQTSEACDDGNTLPGDGCNGLCQIETGYKCPNAGQPCVSLYVCGNGVLDPGEVCDDGNVVPGDGCSSDCLSQDAGYACITAGKPCTKLYVCGDGRVTDGEACDDGNTTSGDGCSSTCQAESGWVCLIPSKPCTRAPRCGDSNVDVSSGEVCDDGNTVDGDGCSADCHLIESGWSCPTPGSPCVYLVKCGDGVISGSEVCDDGNTTSGDGCSADCSKVESGFACPYPGAPCVIKCGDGIVAGTEQCDDGGTAPGDGCGPTCQWEDGWACVGTAPSYICHKTTCGDGVKEGTEGCDDGNLIPGDGCNATCHLEPACTPGAGCTSQCGDGLVITPEECDDGNTVSGDGCSSSCKVEGGYTCSNIQTCEKLNGSCIMRVPVVYRDFIDYNYGGSQDFQIGCGNLTTGLLQNQLNSKGVPVLATDGASSACITSRASFNQWYDFTLAAVANLFSNPIPGEMILWQSGTTGNYVNRYGADGTPWKEFSYNTCSNNATSCAACTVPADGFCFAPCTPQNSTTTSCYLAYNETAVHDGNPLFFPIDNQGITPVAQYSYATVPQEIYNGGWVTDPAYYEHGTTHNFGFTSRVKYWFTYDSTKSYTLTFTGDDDVWVFINGILAVDLGGPHVPASGTVTLSPANVATYKLTSGNVYDIQVFQAERKKTGSSYMLTLTGFNTAKSTCTPICGDGIVTPGEQCDNGTANNTGGYGKCKPDCTRDIYCGDGITNGGEACDNGVNNSAYTLTKSSGCAPGCVLPPYCGDVIVQTNYGEQCDDGTNNGAYGTCSPTCKRAPWCGDAIVQTSDGEQCDDGKNDGTYGTCAPGCVLGQRCGDGIAQTDWGEQCDLGSQNGVTGSGCSPNCKLEGGCGDGVVEPAEQCDDGSNLGGYGKCAPGCVYGPHCGDGVVQKPPEQCDDGTNAGGYGECAPGCVYGPHCGDGIVQSQFEECDDGAQNGSTNDMCSSACKKVGSILT